jgi:hypothetical protein
MGFENEKNIFPTKTPEEETMNNFFDFFDLPKEEINSLQNDIEAYRNHKSDIIHNIWGKRIKTASKEDLIIHESKLDAVFNVDKLLGGDEHFYEAMQSKLMRRHYELHHETGNPEHKRSITQHIEDTHDWLSQHGRIGKWKKEFTEPIFTGARLKLKDMPEFTGEVNDFDSFKAALYSFNQENVDKAKIWLDAIRQNPEELIPNVPEEARDQVYKHREGEIRLFEKLLEKRSAYFQVMAESQDFEEAESWLKAAKESDDYDNRTLDHRERELFKVYCATGKWAEANEVAENSILESSRAERLKRIAELSKKELL